MSIVDTTGKKEIEEVDHTNRLQLSILEEILANIKLTNLYLSHIVDEELSQEDISIKEQL